MPLALAWTLALLLQCSAAEAFESKAVWVPCLIAGGRLPASLLQCGAAPPLVECANVSVPLNYSAPAGSEAINIFTLRIRGADEAKRKGSVWVACGGPGMAQAPEVFGVLYPFLGCAFDVYFADYRGVGTRREPFNSTPMAVNPISSGSPHVRPIGVHRTCGEPDEIKENTHPPEICYRLFFRDQARRSSSPPWGCGQQKEQ